MKKLMIAAAAAAMVGGSFASCVDPTEPEAANCASVYEVKLILKTLGAKQKTTTTKIECEDPVTSSACFMVNGTRKYSGIIASCECVCSAESAVADAKFYFWATHAQVSYCDATLCFSDVVRFGAAASSSSKKVATKIAIASDPIDLVGAGFGTYDWKNGRLLSLNGYIAGLVDAPVCSVKCADPQVAYGFNLCDDETMQPDAVPAYGTWTVKYNSTASRKYMNNSTYVEQNLLPTYYKSACLND